MLKEFKKTDLFAAITVISLAVAYVEARVGVVLEHIDQVKEVITEARETLEQFKKLGAQLEELQTEEFFFPLPAAPQPDSEWNPPPPPLEPFPDPIGGPRA